MNYKSVCIVGVDGTGKTSTVEMLSSSLGAERTVVQYMGARQWETPMAKKYVENNSAHGMLNTIRWLYAYIHEMYYRANKYRNEKKLVIFDRYAYEHVVSREQLDLGWKGNLVLAILRFFLVEMFPKPNLTFYLICPIDISIKRKADITSQDEVDALKNDKRILDSLYIGKQDVEVIDTNINSQSEVLEIMKRIIDSKLH